MTDDSKKQPRDGQLVRRGAPLASDIEPRAEGPEPNARGSEGGVLRPERGELAADALYPAAVRWVLKRGGGSDRDLAVELGIDVKEANCLLERMQTSLLVDEPASYLLEGGATKIYTALVRPERLEAFEAMYRGAVDWVLERGSATNVELGEFLGASPSDARRLLRRMEAEQLVAKPEVESFEVGGAVERFAGLVELEDWRATRSVETEPAVVDAAQQDAGAALDVGAEHGGEEPEPTAVVHREVDAACRLLQEIKTEAQRVAQRTVRVAAWRMIVKGGAVWRGLLGSGAGETGKLLAELADQLARSGAGEDPPSLADVQRWLDGVHAAIHGRPDYPGSLGSLEANSRFATCLRELLNALGLRVIDPKTGRPGVLMHRSSGAAPHGQFYIQATRSTGASRVGKTSTRLPRLILVDSESA